MFYDNKAETKSHRNLTQKILEIKYLTFCAFSHLDNKNIFINSEKFSRWTPISFKDCPSAVRPATPLGKPGNSSTKYKRVLVSRRNDIICLGSFWIPATISSNFGTVSRSAKKPV